MIKWSLNDQKEHLFLQTYLKASLISPRTALNPMIFRSLCWKILVTVINHVSVLFFSCLVLFCQIFTFRGFALILALLQHHFHRFHKRLHFCKISDFLLKLSYSFCFVFLVWFGFFVSYSFICMAWPNILKLAVRALWVGVTEVWRRKGNLNWE